MSFNSFSFILLFLPLVVILWYTLSAMKKWKIADYMLIASSIILYGLFSFKFVIILLLSAFITYEISRLIITSRDKKILLVFGIITNIGLLGYFKYTNFFLENISIVTGRKIDSLAIVLPVGISFYIFSHIAFLVDTYREIVDNYSDPGEKVSAKSVTFTEYLLYITYFPKIIQGPIALPGEMISQFRDKEKRILKSENIAKGMQLFVIGLSKKVLLGDNLAKIADYGFLYTYYMDTITGILVLVAYSFQLYFDFSGYCDMAEGVSYMLGITLPQNFNSPYKALSVRNLWQRWHMTLTRFFVRYVYIPLGGSRKGKLRTALNVLIIFILSGFWHGAGWTYLCWGLIMGIMVVFDDLGIMATKTDIKKSYLLREKPLIVIPEFLGKILTYIMFLISLVFFRSKNMTYAIQYFKQLCFFTWPGFLYKTASVLSISENYLVRQAVNLVNKSLETPVYLASFAIIMIVSAFVMTRDNARELVFGEKIGKGYTVLLVILFVWSFISLSQVSTFIYFNF